MTKPQKNRVILISVLIVVSLIALVPSVLRDKTPDWWPTEEIKLGLDLRGGIYLVLGVKTEEAVKSRLAADGNFIKREMRKEKVSVVRARQTGDKNLEFTMLSERGVSELEKYLLDNYPQLQRQGQKKAGKRTTLIYRIKDDAALAIEKSAVLQAIETVRNRVDQYGVAEPVIVKSGEKRINVQLPDEDDIEKVKKTIGSVAKLEFRLVPLPSSDSASVPSVSMRRKQGGKVDVEEDVLMTGDVVDTANVDINPSTNEPDVSLRLTGAGGRLFESITAENVNRQLAIILDGVVQSHPVIRERIPGGRASISGGFTPEEAHFLALVLRAGALPAPLEFLEQRTVGATLGADSIKSSLLALILGSGLVIIFMAIYYKKAGLLAIGSLILNMGFLLAMLAMLGAVLTLPGVAGLILTVGMAVDANVIIFQRIREELSIGAGASAAVEGGFLKAHWTILDANITTLITAIVLLAFGSGPIQGFAVTLSLGIISSVFCALIVVRLAFELLSVKNAAGELSI